MRWRLAAGSHCPVIMSEMAVFNTIVLAAISVMAGISESCCAKRMNTISRGAVLRYQLIEL